MKNENHELLVLRLREMGAVARLVNSPVYTNGESVHIVGSFEHSCDTLSDLAKFLIKKEGKTQGFAIYYVGDNIVRYALEDKNYSEFVNDSDCEFEDIANQIERVYNFGSKGFVKILYPIKLNISESGQHRIFSKDGKSHVIPSGWIELTWSTKDGCANFV